MAEHPSAKALGYFHSVRYADVKEHFCSKAPVMIPSLPLRVLTRMPRLVLRQINQNDSLAPN